MREVEYKTRKLEGNQQLKGADVSYIIYLLICFHFSVSLCSRNKSTTPLPPPAWRHFAPSGSENKYAHVQLSVRISREWCHYPTREVDLAVRWVLFIRALSLPGSYPRHVRPWAITYIVICMGLTQRHSLTHPSGLLRRERRVFPPRQTFFVLLFKDPYIDLYLSICK